MRARRLLLIDDNPDDIMLVTRALRKQSGWQYEIDLAYTSEEGIRAAAAKRYDCILTDYNFPGISGMELYIRLASCCPATPIIVLTGQVDQAIAARLIKQGAQDYINKGAISSEKLHQLICDAIAGKNNDVNSAAPGKEEYDVLVVDDNEDDVEFYIRGLSKLDPGYRFSHVNSGQAALKVIDMRPPDCVLLDYCLPGANGLDVLNRILMLRPHLPVIILTGQGSETIAVESIKRGAENYMVKAQFSPELLHRNIREAVSLKRLENALAAKEHELETKNRELNKTNAFLDMVLDIMPGYFFVKDENFKLLRANAQFIALYPDKSKDKIIGYTTVEDYTEEDARAFLENDCLAFKHGKHETNETILFPNGEQRTLFTQKKRFTDEDGQHFLMGIASDVTEREALISQLQKSNADLEEFAYIASHDLKSPLNGIRKLVSWIHDDYREQLPAEVQEYFSLINSRAERMARLLEDLLEYSRIGSRLTASETIQLHDMVADVHQINDGHANFTVHVPQVEVVMPRIGLQIVLVNLLSNTIKHHDTGNGHIRLLLNQAPGGYQLEYKDDGPGIAAQYHHKVFNMFQTLRPRDEVEGSGMGLAVVKKVVEHYQGHICLNDCADGVHFSIFWPYSTTEGAARENGNGI